jgi:catechol 2,3-dioxygenase-like lactoylglutathione lyase family enzyme
MFHKPFSGFSINDSEAARDFYTDVLGLDVRELPNGFLQLALDGDTRVLMYTKDDHQPAAFTVLNLPVDDVHVAVRDLMEKGVAFLQYDGMPQDEHGVMTGQGPDIAWFADPAGNVLSVIQHEEDDF